MISKKWWQVYFRIGIAGLTLFVLSLHLGKIEDVGRAMLDIRLPFLIMAVLLMLVNIYIQYRKWLYILRIYYPRVSKLETLASILGGFTLGLITPGRLGELGRGLFLRNLNKLKLTGLTLLDKTFSNFVVFLSGGLAFYYLFKYPFNLSIYILVPFFLIFASLALFLFYLMFHPQKTYLVFQDWSKKSEKLKKHKGKHYLIILNYFYIINL